MSQHSWERLQRPRGSAPLAAVAAVAVLATAASASSQPTPEPDFGNRTDLIDAVRNGRVDVIRTLLDRGADPDEPQNDGATALHHAAHRNDIDAARLLIEAGATVGAANDLGATPLWLAARNGSAAMAAHLLNAGADPNAALTMGETPLMTAARGGNLETVELLLTAGADVNAAELERLQTALMWATAQQHAAVVRVLLDHGADAHARTAIWDQLENTAGNTNPIGNFRVSHGGSTPLLFAARQGDVATARVLVEHGGADVNDTAASGASALIIAAHSGHGPLGIYLLGRGADPNAAGAGYTALHAAVLRGRADLVGALLDHGADPNAPIERGTPGRRFSADYSLRYQFIGTNAFWLAAKYGELESLRLLAAHDADPNAVPDSGMSALQAAMGITRSTENRRNRVGIPAPDHAETEQLAHALVQVILERGVEVNAADTRGDTALHDAVRQQFVSVVELLVDAGADPTAANGRDETPLSLAENTGSAADGDESGARTTIATLLRRLGERR